MHDTKLSVAPLPHQFLESALVLLDAAFEQDPILAWCLFAENWGFDERRTNYLRSYLRYHHDALMPALGAWRSGDLVAVSYFAPASRAESSGNFAKLGHQIASTCGELSLRRIDLLRESSGSNSSVANSSWIEFIGVSPMLQGEGIGSTHPKCDLGASSRDRTIWDDFLGNRRVAQYSVLRAPWLCDQGTH